MFVQHIAFIANFTLVWHVYIVFFCVLCDWKFFVRKFVYFENKINFIGEFALFVILRSFSRKLIQNSTTFYKIPRNSKHIFVEFVSIRLSTSLNNSKWRKISHISYLEFENRKMGMSSIWNMWSIFRSDIIIRCYCRLANLSYLPINWIQNDA